jgi:AAA domain
VTRHVESVRESEIHRKRIDWLVPGRVPIGYLTLLIGVEGLGKSQWLTWLAAMNSLGKLANEPGVTLICSAEDAWDSTIRPRLEAWNANLELVRFVAVYEDGEGDGLLLPDDINDLAREIHDTGATLCTVDPVLAHLGREIDSHKDASTRQALAPLARVADV